MRRAYRGSEILYREDNLIGINIGYDFCGQHESGYNGREIIEEGSKPKSDNKSNPFSKEIVKNPEYICLTEFEKGKFALTNDMYLYMDRQGKNEYFNSLISDNATYESFLTDEEKPNFPKIVSSWSSDSFNLVSSDKQSNELLQKLYEEMQKKNVAISSDYSFIFENRGLSFVLVDQLSKEDLENKKLIDNYENMAQQFQNEYTKWLINEGVKGFKCEYPIEFFNVQIHNLKKSEKGIMPEFYLELYDQLHKGGKNENTHLYGLPSIMAGDEIKFLTSVIKTDEFGEFANTHSSSEIEEYLNSKLEFNKQESEKNIANSAETQDKNYSIDENSFNAVAKSQREGMVKRTAVKIEKAVSKLLHPGKDKSAEKGE